MELLSCHALSISSELHHCGLVLLASHPAAPITWTKINWYNINCSFATTLFNSTIGPCALLSNHTSLAGAFHGHAHCQLCQLENLAMYINGLGLEVLKTCERTFSKLNTLATMTQYASVFHSQQAISMYFAHNDEHKVYSNFCTSYEERASLITNAYFSKVPGCELSSGTWYH